MREEYLALLRSINRDGMERLINWIEKSSFFTDPASANHHGAFEGGLVKHSLNVYNRLKELVGDSDSVKIIGLLHDVCKIGSYEISYRNVKDEKGVWNQVAFYKHKKEAFAFGHGEKSVYMISTFIKLKKEEALAIRWHMGAYEPKEVYGYLGEAIEECPLIIYTHAADMLATYVDEKE